LVSWVHQVGFGRPAGQKSKRSKASDVHGPCSLGSFSWSAAFEKLLVRFDGAWWPCREINAVGSENDLRKGESRDLLPVRFRIAEGGLKPEPSSISSNINCVDSDGMKSSFAVPGFSVGETTGLVNLSRH
jgi:hypothetical protein